MIRSLRLAWWVETALQLLLGAGAVVGAVAALDVVLHTDALSGAPAGAIGGLAAILFGRFQQRTADRDVATEAAGAAGGSARIARQVLRVVDDERRWPPGTSLERQVLLAVVRARRGTRRWRADAWAGAVLLGAFMVLYVVAGATASPWWWLGLPAWAALLAHSVARRRRRRRCVAALADAVAADQAGAAPVRS